MRSDVQAKKAKEKEKEKATSSCAVNMWIGMIFLGRRRRQKRVRS